MNDTTIHVPRDFQLWREYAALSERLRSPAVAAGILALLWTALAYEVESTGRLGWIGKEALWGRLDQWFRRGLARGDAESGRAALVAAGGLEGCGMLVESDGGYVCARFVAANGHLDPNFKPSHIFGHEKSVFVRFRKRLEQDCGQLALGLPEGFYKDAQGQPLGLPEVKGAVGLILSLDNILGRKGRLKSELTEDLVRAAHDLVQTHTPGALARVYDKLLRARGTAALPASTELLLGEMEAWM